MKKLIITSSLVLLSLFGTATATSAASTTYKVKSGDTLYKIASVHKVSVKDIQSWNNLKSATIRPNQVLKVAKLQAAKTSAKPAAKAPAPAAKKEFTVTATAYTGSCKGCSGITATGINLKKNPNLKVISVDPKVIKLGSKVWVEGYGTAIAGDKGSAIRGNKIDVFIPNQKEALKWGRKTVKVRIL
ncbi:3D domain-containing protein [Priestia flexa]|uniref:3D domain-containing protein n=1 Tax=Priestia flexa TaxID=86664 RepID=UPI003FD43E21